MTTTHATARLIALPLALLTGMALPAPALAAQVGISPTRILLTPDQRTGAITLRNNGREAVEFQVTVKRWSMSTDGQWQLENLPAGEALAVYPLAFRIAPGKTQALRAGLPRTAPIGQEQAYRVVLKELPPAQREGTGFRVLNEFSLPVFVNDGDAVPTVTVQAGTISRGKWLFHLHAEGDGHVAPTAATLRVLDAAGKTLHQEQVTLPYVLAGAAAPVRLSLPVSACANAREYRLDADAPVKTLQGLLPAGTQRSCGN